MSFSVLSSTSRSSHCSGSGNGLSFGHCFSSIMLTRRDSKISRKASFGSAGENVLDVSSYTVPASFSLMPKCSTSTGTEPALFSR